MKFFLSLLVTFFVLAGSAGAVPIVTIDQSNVSLGDEVSFTVTDLPKRVKHPRIAVRAFQNDQLVYGEAGAASAKFLLGGAASDWLRNGGPAECSAELFYFNNKDKPVTLAWTYFHAEG